MNLDYLLKHQEESLAKFLQKDVPVEKRQMCGIHKELVRAFGLKNHYNIYIEKIPSPELVRYLAKKAGSSSLDIITSIRAGLPPLTLVDADKTHEITSRLESHDVPYKIEPSGLVVSNNEYKAIVQYCDYRVELEDPNPLEASTKESYLKTKIRILSPDSKGLWESPIRTNPKYTNSTHEAILYVTFRTLVYKENKEISRDEDEMFFTRMPMPTKNFSFIINGVERFIISVRQRPVGILFFDTNAQNECFIESAGVFNHRIIRLRNEKSGLHLLVSETNRIPIIGFFKALGLTDEQIKNYFLVEEVDTPEHLSETCEEIMITEDTDKFKAWEVLSKDQLNELPKGIKIKHIKFESNPTMWNTFINIKPLSEEISLKQVYRSLERTALAPTDLKYLYTRVCSWLSSLDLDFIGRQITNKKLKPVFDELGETPSLNHTNLTLLDVVAATRYLIYLNEKKAFKDGTVPTCDDPLSLSTSRILTLCELLENVWRAGLSNSVRSTREHVMRELNQLTYKKSN